MKIGTRLLLVVLSAVMGIVVFPPIGWAGFAVIAWLPLFFALREVKPSQAFFLGLLHGLIFHAVTMSWLMNIFVQSPWIIFPLVMIMSLFTAFFTRGYAVAQLRYGSGWVLVMFAACWWGALEFCRAEIYYLKFPWMTPGVGLGPTFISPILGVSGASFLIILATALVCQKRQHCIAGAVMMLGLLGAMTFQNYRVVADDAEVNVMAVQSEEFDIERYIGLTREAALDSEPDIVIWPEYAFGYDVRKYPVAMEQLQKLAGDLDSVVVVGTRTDTGLGPKDWYNTALTFDQDEVLGVHYKNHTVHFFNDGMAGTEAQSVDAGEWNIGTPICFDCDYQDVIRRMVKNGAEFLAVPSMDGAHWGDKEHYQHAEFFRHRAAENGRWIAVAATSGVTQIIDPNGRRVSALPILEEGVLVGQVGTRQGLTFYTRVGWLFPWVTMALGALWMLWVFIQGMKEKMQSKDRRIA